MIEILTTEQSYPLWNARGGQRRPESGCGCLPYPSRDRKPAGVREFIMLSLIILMTGCGKDESLYKDKPATYWAQRLADQDRLTRRQAAEALGALTAKVFVPDLIIAL